MSEPLAQDLLIAGPIVLNLFASIDQDDMRVVRGMSLSFKMATSNLAMSSAEESQPPPGIL